MANYLVLWECPGHGHVFASQEPSPSGVRDLTCNKCGDKCSPEETIELEERRDLDDLDQLLGQAGTLGFL